MQSSRSVNDNSWYYIIPRPPLSLTQGMKFWKSWRRVKLIHRSASACPSSCHRCLTFWLSPYVNCLTHGRDLIFSQPLSCSFFQLLLSGIPIPSSSFLTKPSCSPRTRSSLTSWDENIRGILRLLLIYTLLCPSVIGTLTHLVYKHIILANDFTVLVLF